MQKIVPCLWFNNNGLEAAKFYVTCFQNAKLGAVTHYDSQAPNPSGLPKGSVLTVTFKIAGQEFMALNGGPAFKPTPANSFFVECSSEKELDSLWKKLSKGGSVLMPLATYPFSKKYGWLNDKYGFSWQLSLSRTGGKQRISPSLMFVGKVNGKVKEAIKHYHAIFKGSKAAFIAEYEKGERDTPGHVKFSTFSLGGQNFHAMESSGPHKFTFSPAVSFIVNCKDQKEIDYYWAKLGNGGKYSVCGWLDDKYGVSWQVVPTGLEKLITSKDKKKSSRVMAALMKMTKLDVAKLEAA